MSKRSLPAASLAIIAAPWVGSAVTMVGATAGPGVAVATAGGGALLLARRALRHRSNNSSTTSVHKAAKAAKKRGVASIPAGSKSARSLAGGRKRSSASAGTGPGRAGGKRAAGHTKKTTAARHGGTATAVRKTTTTKTAKTAGHSSTGGVGLGRSSKRASRSGGKGSRSSLGRQIAASTSKRHGGTVGKRGGLFSGKGSNKGARPGKRHGAASLGHSRGKRRHWWNPATWRRKGGLHRPNTGHALRGRNAASRAAHRRYDETRRKTEHSLRRKRKNRAWSLTRRAGTRLRDWQPRGRLGRFIRLGSLASTYLVGAIASTPKALVNTYRRLGVRVTRFYQLGSAWVATWTGIPLSAAALNRVELADNVRENAPRIKNRESLNRARPERETEERTVQTNMNMIRELIEGAPAQEDFSGVAVEQYMKDTVDALAALQARMGADLTNIGENLDHLDGGEGVNQLYDMISSMVNVTAEIAENWIQIHAEKLEAQKNPTEASKNWESAAARDY